jgi:hypothetical protein
MGDDVWIRDAEMKSEQRNETGTWCEIMRYEIVTGYEIGMGN